MRHGAGRPYCTPVTTKREGRVLFCGDSGLGLMGRKQFCCRLKASLIKKLSYLELLLPIPCLAVSCLCICTQSPPKCFSRPAGLALWQTFSWFYLIGPSSFCFPPANDSLGIVLLTWQTGKLRPKEVVFLAESPSFCAWWHHPQANRDTLF